MTALFETRIALVDGARPDGKLALILLAHHHGSENIASQRFRGLLRHLPRTEHSVHVLSGPWLRDEAGQEAEVTSVPAPLLATASIVARLAVLSAMLRPDLAGLGRIAGDSWIARVVELARAKVRTELAAGNRVVVMATYSPIDALIAARLIAQAEGVPFVQDFRDGLVYENLGRRGAIFRFLRRFLEGWAVRPAARVTAVTPPLVSHFKSSFPGVPVDLLYNGFDAMEMPDSFQSHHGDDSSAASEVLVGHFGRVAASDAGSVRSLKMLLDFLGRVEFLGKLAFFGTLTEFDIAELNKRNLKFEYYGNIPRDKAIANMQAVDALLLVTSDRASVATGKIFEYLFSGRRIVLATLRWNEAARLLEEIGDDDVILDFSQPASIPSPVEFSESLRRPFIRNRERIKRFEKSAQAIELAAILRAAAGGVGENR